MITFRGRTDDTGHEWLGVVDLETGIVKELVSVNIDDTGVFYPVAWSFTDEFLAYEKCDRLVDARSCSIWITNQYGAPSFNTRRFTRKGMGTSLALAARRMIDSLRLAQPPDRRRTPPASSTPII